MFATNKKKLLNYEMAKQKTEKYVLTKKKKDTDSVITNFFLLTNAHLSIFDIKFGGYYKSR